MRAECAVSSAIIFIAARYASDAKVDFSYLARKVIQRIGYDQPDFNAKICSILSAPQELPLNIGATLRRDQADRRGDRPGGRQEPGDRLRVRLRPDPGSSCRCRSCWPTSWPGALRRFGTRRSCPTCCRTGRSRSAVAYDRDRPVQASTALRSWRVWIIPSRWSREEVDRIHHGPGGRAGIQARRNQARQGDPDSCQSRTDPTRAGRPTTRG